MLGRTRGDEDIKDLDLGVTSGDNEAEIGDIVLGRTIGDGRLSRTSKCKSS